MNILFPYLARWHSANRSRYHQLLTHLCRRGHRVFVLTAPPMALADISAQDIGRANGDLPAGMMLGELHAPTSLRSFWRCDIPRTKLLKKGLISLSSIAQVRRLIDRQKIDLLFLYNLPQVLLMQMVDCPIHFDLADDLVAMMEAEDLLLSRFGGQRAAAWVQRRMVRQARTVTVASSVLAEQMARPVLMLPNGADLAELDRIDDRRWPRDRQRPTVGFVGAFEYWVDVDLILAVAGRLPQCTFLLVGGGRRLHEIQQKVERYGLANVRLTGPQPYRAAMSYVAGMDVCLLPFYHSPVSDGSCPLKLFEYAALRKPVVSTSTVEVVRIGAGWVSFADDPDTFAQAVLRAIDYPPSVETGRALVEHRYNWPMLAEKLENYLIGAAG